MLKLSTLQGLGPDVTQLQTSIKTTLDPITAVPIIDGVLIDGVTLTTGQANLLQHGPGRRYRGYHVTMKSADANIWNDSYDSATASRQLSLRCSVNCTVSVWVF